MAPSRDTAGNIDALTIPFGSAETFTRARSKPPLGLDAHRQAQREELERAGGRWGLAFDGDPALVGSLEGNVDGCAVRVTPDEATKVRVAFRRRLPLFLATAETQGPALTAFHFEDTGIDGFFPLARASAEAARRLRENAALQSFLAEWDTRIVAMSVGPDGIACSPSDGLDLAVEHNENWLSLETIDDLLPALLRLADALEQALEDIHPEPDDDVRLEVTQKPLPSMWLPVFGGGLLGGGLLLLGLSALAAGVAFWQDGPTVPFWVLCLGAMLVVLGALRAVHLRRRWTDPSWQRREIRFDAETVSVPRLQLFGSEVTIAYADVRAVRHFRQNTRPMTRVVFAGGELVYYDDDLGPLQRTFIDELRRRSGLRDPDHDDDDDEPDEEGDHDRAVEEESGPAPTRE